MSKFLYTFFHNETNDKTEKGQNIIPSDRSLWPEAWRIVTYKEYTNFSHIALPKPKGILFESLLTKRASKIEKLKYNAVTIENIAYILACGSGIRDKSLGEERTAPSAGARYPLETYVCLFKECENLKCGIYHYNVRINALEPVLLKEFTKEEKSSFFVIPDFDDVSFIVCITAILNRTVQKYGSRGYRFILLESGHVAQNMLLAATEKGLTGIPLGGINENIIENYIGIQNGDERVLYAISF